MRIGIYGGTFNPPHLGHMLSAEAAVKELALDRLFFVPAALPPHKRLPSDGAGEEARLEMTSLMADGLGQKLGRPSDVGVLDLELSRSGKSYTADTLEELRRRYPGDELWLLMGSDMFFTLQTWREPEKIMSLAGIAAFSRREEDGGEAMRAQAFALKERFGAEVRLLDLDEVRETSSTELRRLLDRGEGSGELWPPVYGYILRSRLYGVKRDLKALSDEELRSASYSMIKAKRIPHVGGTEAAAVALAERWGADVNHARRAAILHDCTKYLCMEEQLKLCARYGIVLDELEKQAVKLLHAKTGAAVARAIYGVPDDIYRAIYWHTTGHADMTILEKIIYLADYMEPTRDFPGVEELRKRAECDLDSAVLLGFEMSIQEMKDRGMPIHHNTVEARDFLQQQRTSEIEHK